MKVGISRLLYNPLIIFGVETTISEQHKGIGPSDHEASFMTDPPLPGRP